MDKKDTIYHIRRYVRKEIKNSLQVKSDVDDWNLHKRSQNIYIHDRVWWEISKKIKIILLSSVLYILSHKSYDILDIFCSVLWIDEMYLHLIIWVFPTYHLHYDSFLVLFFFYHRLFLFYTVSCVGVCECEKITVYL